jgi:putative spermidine/putrescine transport system ATP-binding protein
MERKNMLELRGVSKHYGATVALDRVDLDVAEGEFVTLLGPSGSGKTTLLKIIVGFEAPTEGTVSLRGRDISGLPPADRGIGMVFQQYALFPHMTVADNIAYGLKRRGWPKAKRDERVAEMLDLIQLSGYGSRRPTELSGGQQQRVALARALAYGPEILLMDEPLGALDRLLRLEIEEQIRHIHRELGTTVVYVTHDQQEALALSDRIAIMRDGHILAIDTPEALYFRPQSEFVAGFFAGSNLLPVELVGNEGPGRAKVRFDGQVVSCPAASELGDKVKLAVRRRSLHTRPVENALVIRGRVDETLLFGDERQVSVDVPNAGKVVAALDARDSGEISVDKPIELFAPLNEVIVVSAETGKE